MYGETLAIEDCYSDLDENEDGSHGQNGEATEKKWAQLIPLNPLLTKTVLLEPVEKYSFGKGEDCDCILPADAFSSASLAVISKKHFIIHKQLCSADVDDFDVVLQDISSNGTLVNGNKVGKNKFRVLQSNDEISLATNSIKVFMFVSAKSTSSSVHSDVADKYLVSKLLGKGACGDVFLVFLEADFSRQFAMKIVDKKSFTSTIIAPSATTSGVLRSSANDVLSEVNILKQLQHPCIIHVHEVFDYPDRLYLVLERAIGGELFDRVVKKDGLDEFTAKLYFYQMLLAIEYLHSKNVVHRDLKPENILLASEADMTLIKVTDFGLSKLVGEQSLMKTLCGTPNYLAPEIIKTSGMGHYNSKVDSWSLGVILFIMLAAYPPFSDDYNDMPLVEQIKKARFSFADHAWKSVSKEAKNLISKMIVVNAAKRFNCTQALRHNWLKDEVMVKQVEELMKKDIDTRDATAKKPSSEDVNASVMQNISHESEADLLNNTVQLKNSCKENADLTVGNVSEKDIVWKLEEDSSESCSGAKKAKVDKLN